MVSKVVALGEILSGYAYQLDAPKIGRAYFDFPKMRDDVTLYIRLVDKLSVGDLSFYIENSQFKGRVKDFVKLTFEGAITRLIPMYIQIPKATLYDESEKKLETGIIVHTLLNYASTTESSETYLEKLFSYLEALETHTKTVRALGVNVKIVKILNIYRCALWECSAIDQDEYS